MPTISANGEAHKRYNAASFASVELAVMRNARFNAYFTKRANPADLLAIAEHFVEADISFDVTALGI
jgi:hypothetical protein